MNKFQKIATRMAKNDMKVLGDIADFRTCKNGWLKKFRDGNFKYHKALQFKNDFIKE